MIESSLKICNCEIPSKNSIISSNKSHSYCSKCGTIILKGINDTMNYILKPKQKQKAIEINPIGIIKWMKKTTEIHFPNLNNEYNHPNNKNEFNEDAPKSFQLYFKNRKMMILLLQKMMKMLDYSDLTFYQCLFYIDIYLSNIITEETSEKDILYYLIGFFLCASKLRETDIYEPRLDNFCDIKKKVHLSEEKILYYELVCLKIIKYNIFSYSAYDWLSELLNVGVVFDCEIDKNHSIILVNGHRHSILNTINKYAMKLLLNITIKEIYIKYSPLYISLSLILIAREKYLDKNLIKPALFNNLTELYGIKFENYENCYREMKLEIEGNNIIGRTIENEVNELVIEDKEVFKNDQFKRGVISQNKHNSSNHIIRFVEKNETGESINKLMTETNEIINDKPKAILDLSEDRVVKNEMGMIRSSKNLGKFKFQNKNKLIINCKNDIFNRNENNNNLDFIRQKTENIDYNEQKTKCDDKTLNKFLKSNIKTLAPIKIKNNNYLSNENKRYLVPNVPHRNEKNNNLEQVRKILFTDNSFSNRKLNDNNPITISNIENKIRKSNYIPNVTAFDKMISEEIKNGDKKKPNIDNLKQKKWKSKNKLNNKLKGKETKIVVSYKRNQSLNLSKGRK